MKAGINYEEYMNDIKKKNDAWKVVYDCFSFAYEKFSADVLDYFEAIEEIYEAGYTETGELRSEEECVANINDSIRWYEQQLEWATKCHNEDSRRYKIDKYVMKNLQRALKHKFGVDW